MADDDEFKVNIQGDGEILRNVPPLSQGNGGNRPQTAGMISYPLGFRLHGSDATASDETLRFIEEVRDEVDKHLTTGDIRRMIEEYEQLPPAARRDVTPRTIHRLLEVLMETSVHGFFVLLQGLLHRVERPDLFGKVAEMAETKLETLGMPFFSRTNPSIRSPDGALSFKILVDRDFSFVNDELINIRRKLALLLKVEEDSIVFVRLNMANSVWITILAPAWAVRALYEAIKDEKRQDVRNYLASMYIKTFALPPEESPRGGEGEAKKSGPQESEGKMSQSEESKLCKACQEKKPWRSWTKEEVIEHFRRESSLELAEVLKNLTFEGKHLAGWNPAMLRTVGLSDQHALLVAKCLDNLGVFHAKGRFKVINDNIHGFIFLHPLCMKIIDTPEFQRLRSIKQLGAVYHAFPAASHNRFEHSLGVGHLAFQVVTALQERQPALDITEEDVLCVTIAGLCYNLGHGPYSKLFTEFIHKVNKNEDWEPKYTAVKMFDHLIERNELMPAVYEAGLTDDDVKFIQEQIAGTHADREPLKGRPKEKHFLYEIVGRRQNGIDVVQWDEIARDSFMLGVPHNFDHKRFIAHIRALETFRGWRLCARDIDADHHLTKFQDQFFLARRAYFHPVSQAIEVMLEHVLLLVEKAGFNPYLGKEGGEFKLSKCVDDPSEFCKLNDSFFHAVEMTTCPELKEAREILKSIHKRHLYRPLAETNPSHKKISLANVPDSLSGNDGTRVKVAYMEYTWLDSHDNQDVFFYRKNEPQKAITLNPSQVSVILPKRCVECIVRLFSKDLGEENKEKAIKTFGTWCSDNGLDIKTSRVSH